MTSSLSSAPENGRAIEIVASFGALAPRYDLVLCDVWGVLHDGLAAFADASAALCRYRDGGGRVVLVSNAPRPGFLVARQVVSLGTSADAFDDIVTSGDVTRALVAEQGGRTMFHLGPERDIRLFEGLAARPGSLEACDFVVCTGLFDDETETVDDYAVMLDAMRRRDLLMICANPDIVVERGHLLIPCAGALAAAYEALGGPTVTGGKPHRPIYNAAMEAGAKALRRAPELERVLAIGDALRTDVAGARAFGVDVLLLARGIHAAELGYAGGAYDPAEGLAWLDRQSERPTAVAPALSWS